MDSLVLQFCIQLAVLIYLIRRLQIIFQLNEECVSRILKSLGGFSTPAPPVIVDSIFNPCGFI